MNKIPKIKWKKNMAKYSSGWLAYAGGIKIGSVEWYFVAKEGDEEGWCSDFYLPGFRSAKIFKSDRTAKSIVRKIFEAWYKKLHSK